MTLDPTTTHIYCQTCATAWRKDDTNTGYYFRSTSTFAIGDYASPAAIVAVAEEMTFCPSCDVEALAEHYRKPAPGIQESPFYTGQSRMHGEMEEDIAARDAELSEATGEDPDVTHQP